MKILFVSTSVVALGTSRYGGIEKMELDMIKAQTARGHQVTVAAPVGSKVPKGVELIETVKLPEEQDNDQLAFEQSLINWSSNGKVFDVIHDFSHGHRFAWNLGNVYPIISHLWDPVVHKYNKAPYNILCLSRWQAHRFEQLYNQKARVMPPWVDTDFYTPVGDPDRERFLFVGKLTAEKGVHLALEYARELEVPLDIVGGLIPSDSRGYYNELSDNVDYAQSQGNNVTLKFNATEEEKLKLMQNAKAVIYPVQQDEAHWLVGLEAWACDTTTIVLGKGSMSEIHSGSTRLKVGSIAEDKEQFLEAMKNTKVPLGQCRYYAKQEYGLETVARRYEELYKEVAGGERW